MEIQTAASSSLHASLGLGGCGLKGGGGTKQSPRGPCMALASPSFMQSSVSEPGWSEQAVREHLTGAQDRGSAHALLEAVPEPPEPRGQWKPGAPCQVVGAQSRPG